MVSVTLEGLWMVSHRITDFQFFVQIHRSGPAIFFSLWTMIEHVSYPSKKLLINQKTSWRWWVFLSKDYGWFMIELSILNFSSNFTGCNNFEISHVAIIFSFWTIMEHVSYPSKKLLIKPKTSSRWWVLLRKDYGWFLIELSIFDFSSNFTGPDLQKFSVFELSWSTLVIHQKSS